VEIGNCFCNDGIVTIYDEFVNNIITGNAMELLQKLEKLLPL